MEKMDALKTFVISIFIGISSYLVPIEGEIQGLLVLFGCNFAAGLAVSLMVENEKFKFKKAFRCFIESTIFVLFIAAMFSIGERKSDLSGTIQCISFVTYIVVWFYTQNIIRNLRALFKKDSVPYKIFSFLYYVVSVEFVKKIPFLVDYFNSIKAEKEESK